MAAGAAGRPLGWRRFSRVKERRWRFRARLSGRGRGARPCVRRQAEITRRWRRRRLQSQCSCVATGERIMIRLTLRRTADQGRRDQQPAHQHCTIRHDHWPLAALLPWNADPPQLVLPAGLRSIQGALGCSWGQPAPAAPAVTPGASDYRALDPLPPAAPRETTRIGPCPRAPPCSAGASRGCRARCLADRRQCHGDAAGDVITPAAPSSRAEKWEPDAAGARQPRTPWSPGHGARGCRTRSWATTRPTPLLESS